MKCQIFFASAVCYNKEVKSPGGGTCLPAGRLEYILQIGRRAVRRRHMWYVYAIEGINIKKLYKGITDNLDRRLKQHLNGQSVSTRNMLLAQLIHVELCDSRAEARKMEKYFKSGFGRENLNQISDEIAQVAELVYAQS